MGEGGSVGRVGVMTSLPTFIQEEKLFKFRQIKLCFIACTTSS